MRARLALVGGAAALVGVALVARPGEPTPPERGIVVVRGGAAVGPLAHAAPARTSPVAEAMPAGPRAEDFGDAGIWANPAEFAPPEPAD